jgi:spore coat protein U-like protein
VLSAALSRRTLLIGLALLWVQPGLAGRAEAACSLSVTGGVAFGSYNVFSASPLDATTTIAYRCGPQDQNIAVWLSTGTSGTFAYRTLVSGSNVLRYNLYLDAACTLIWGDGTGGSSAYYIADPPKNVWVDLTVYGRAPAGQDVPAGSYTDTITVTLNF